MTVTPFRELTVVSIGEVLMDFSTSGTEGLGAAREWVASPGGAPANVAAGVARLGGLSAFIGAAGSDPFGGHLITVLTDMGVDTESARVVPLRTTVAFVAAGAGGIPDFLFYRGSDAALEPDDVPLGLLTRSTFLYAGSMALLSEPSASATRYAVEAAREAETMIAIDPNLRPSSWPSLAAAREAILPLIRAADVLKMNDEEARLLADTPDLDRAMSTLAEERTLLVITLGLDGCRWQCAGRRGTVGATAIDARDPTGAGDAFMAALLVELHARQINPAFATPLDLAGIEIALAFACAAGAYACQQTGAMSSLPTREQAEELLDEVDGADL